jgi:hypothetical protein
VNPRVSLNTVKERKILHYQEYKLGHPAHGSSLYRLSYPDSVSILKHLEKSSLKDQDKGGMTIITFNIRDIT